MFHPTPRYRRGIYGHHCLCRITVGTRSVSKSRRSAYGTKSERQIVETRGAIICLFAARKLRFCFGRVAHFTTRHVKSKIPTMSAKPTLCTVPLEALRNIVMCGGASPLFPVTNLCGVSRAMRALCERMFAESDFWHAYFAAMYPQHWARMLEAATTGSLGNLSLWRRRVITTSVEHLARATVAILATRLRAPYGNTCAQLQLPLNISVFDATSSPIDTAAAAFTFRDMHVTYSASPIASSAGTVCSSAKFYRYTIGIATFALSAPSFILPNIAPRVLPRFVETNDRAVCAELSDDLRARCIMSIPSRFTVALCIRLDILRLQPSF